MPSKSDAQARLMAAAAHDPEIRKRKGIPLGVARDFVAADSARGRLSHANRGHARKKRKAVTGLRDVFA